MPLPISNCVSSRRGESFLLCVGFVCLMVAWALLSFKNEAHSPEKIMTTMDRGRDTVSSVSNPVTKMVGRIRAPSGSVWQNKYDLVHVVQTDFLQYQLDLLHLNRARLRLFETFTLPSMKQQTNQEFLWLIWTDPNLTPEFRTKLVDLVKDLKSVAVVGFRRNKNLDFRDLNGVQESEVDESLFAGNPKLLKSYHDASRDRLLLETRLDADDSLNKEYIEGLQHQASETIALSDSTRAYRVFCAEHHTEWRYYKPKQHDNQEGHLVHYHNPSFCINSGLSIGYQTDAKSQHLRQLGECNMNQWLEQCMQENSTGLVVTHPEGTGYLDHHCLARTRLLRKQEWWNNPTQAVLLSRTPTAAGMKRVFGTEQTYKHTFESIQAQKDAWNMVADSFGVEKERSRLFGLKWKTISSISSTTLWKGSACPVIHASRSPRESC